jgi:predicted Zn-dependent protease
MISEDEARDLIDIAVRHGARQKADGVEATVSASDVATSRFANNGMTQNQSPRHVSISVRVQKNGKQARLSSDQITPAGVRRLVENAITSAAFLEPDDEMLPLPKPQLKREQKNVNRFDTKTANFTPEQRARCIKEMIDIARERDLIAAGIFSTGTAVEAIGNSAGLFRFHKETSAEISVTMKHIDKSTGGESTGWAKRHSTKVSDIDPRAMARTAAQKAIASANPQDIQPGKYTVILEPSAVLDLLCSLDYDFTGTSFTDKLSCFLNKLGKQLLGTNVSITDDVYHPLQSGAPFDGEGLQRQPVKLVENGFVKRLVYGRRSALKLQAQPSGHGLAEPNADGEFPHNIVVSGDTVELEEMIRSTERGILLTRVWYVREVDPTTKIVTGMTRDGTFLVENGAIKCGIKNLRFNESLLGMLNNVVALGPALRTAGEEGEPAVVPALKVENFNFSSVTTF